MSRILRTSAALVSGLIVINGVTLLWAFAVAAAVWPELAPRADGSFSVPPDDHPAYLAEMLTNVFAAALAGFVCARMAKRREIAHVAALGGFLLFASLAYLIGWMGAGFGEAKPLWAHAGTAVGLVMGLALGAWLWRRRNAHRGDARRSSAPGAGWIVRSRRDTGPSA